MIYNNKFGRVEEVHKDFFIIDGKRVNTTTPFAHNRCARMFVGDKIQYNTNSVNDELIYLRFIKGTKIYQTEGRVSGSRGGNTPWLADQDDPDPLGEGLGYSSDVGGW